MPFDMKYEIRNPEIEAALKRIGRSIGDKIPPNYGFALFIFGFNDIKELFYISDAQRRDMINAMKEFIAKFEEN